MTKKTEAISVPELLAIFHCDRRTIARRLRAAGVRRIGSRHGGPLYPAAEAKAAFLAYEENSPRAPSSEMQAARTRKAIADAVVAESTALREYRRVVDVEIAVHFVEEKYAKVRARLTRIPDDIGEALGAAKGATAHRDIVRDAIYEALAELSSEAA